MCKIERNFEEKSLKFSVFSIFIPSLMEKVVVCSVNSCSPDIYLYQLKIYLVLPKIPTGLTTSNRTMLLIFSSPPFPTLPLSFIFIDSKRQVLICQINTRHKTSLTMLSIVISLQGMFFIVYFFHYSYQSLVHCHIILAL